MQESRAIIALKMIAVCTETARSRNIFNAMV